MSYTKFENLVEGTTFNYCIQDRDYLKKRKEINNKWKIKQNTKVVWYENTKGEEKEKKRKEKSRVNRLSLFILQNSIKDCKID